MDLLQVKKQTYEVQQLVEGWESLIWTERYQTPGDFELVTQDIDRTMALLPERSLCTLRDTNEVAMVESLSIETNDDGIDELTVKGRTVDFFPGENRVWTNAPYGKKTSMAKKYAVRQAVCVWLWNAICNDTGNDRIVTTKTYPANNALPNVIVTDSVPKSTDGPLITRKVQNGLVGDELTNFLASGKMGIRTIRPNGTSGRKVYIHADGEYELDPQTGITELRFDIYMGRDLSDSVVFSWQAGHLQTPSYLLSSETFKTGCFVDGDARTHYYTNPDAIVGSNSGFNRRDTYVDGGSKDTGMTDDDFEEGLEDQGNRAVNKEGRHVNDVDAQISPDINFFYNKDYRLGDRVMVQGRYGTRDKKYVMEFIRTQDSNGEAAYPTLSTTLS